MLEARRSVKEMLFCWRRGRKLQQALFLLILTMCATILLKVYTSRDCELSDLRRNSGNPRSAICRDRLYQHLRLAPLENINCSVITRGNLGALEQAAHQKFRHQPTEEEYMNLTQDCHQYRASWRFLPVSLSQEEEDFPITYSMVIHNNLEMFERLLRSLYTPQNIYCVHVDAKAPEGFLHVVRAIVSCFDNVFVASRLEKVVYASWSRVQADLNCMEELMNSPVPWKYLLNTYSTDFPIKTNAEMVRALRVLNGQNSLESIKPFEMKMIRWQVCFKVQGDRIIRTQVTKDPPPINSPIFTGNAYFVVSQDFVKAVFEQPRVKKLVAWGNDTYSPDEHLWATLNRMPEVPGSMPYHDKYELSDMISLARLVKWRYLEGDISKGAPYPPCTGIHRCHVCVYGAGDLHWMLQQHHLLANKFDPSVDNVAIQCLEEYLRHKALYGEEL